MGLFDRFKKQDCEICGKEVGMFGYKKLEDGEICKDCVKLLSPWFEDRRHATVAQIKEQIAYREQNAKDMRTLPSPERSAMKSIICTSKKSAVCPPASL